jgi:hypothetical protein
MTEIYDVYQSYLLFATKSFSYYISTHINNVMADVE